MSKGISLEDFKKQLDSEAQANAKRLKEHADRLAEELVKAKKKIESLEKDSYFLYNRCRALSYGVFCPFCGLRDQCKTIMAKYEEEGDPSSVPLDSQITTDRLELYAALGQAFKPD